jgi:hypothetical protein
LLFYVRRYLALEIAVTAAVYLGMFTAKLLVPMVAHGLFDIGGMIHFRDFMTRSEKPA